MYMYMYVRVHVYANTRACTGSSVTTKAIDFVDRISRTYVWKIKAKIMQITWHCTCREFEGKKGAIVGCVTFMTLCECAFLTEPCIASSHIRAWLVYM